MLIPFTTQMMPSVTKHQVRKNMHMSGEGLAKNATTLR